MVIEQGKRHRVVIIGAGPGGICAGIQLSKAGITDFVMLEKADGVRGTWWHNRYPGTPVPRYPGTPVPSATSGRISTLSLLNSSTTGPNPSPVSRIFRVTCSTACPNMDWGHISVSAQRLIHYCGMGKPISGRSLCRVAR